MLNLIELSNEEISSLMIIGHNPSMHNVFEQLSKQTISKFPTCGLASIAFQDSWKNIAKLVADEINFITPKSLKGLHASLGERNAGSVEVRGSIPQPPPFYREKMEISFIGWIHTVLGHLQSFCSCCNNCNPEIYIYF